MAIQDKSLSAAEHDWYATRSGLPSHVPLSQHKYAYFASRGIGNEPFSVVYNADTLPQNTTPAWTPVFTPDPLVNTTVEISPAGKLHVQGDGVNLETVHWTGPDTNIVNARGITVEMRLKLNANDLVSTNSLNIYLQVQTETSLIYIGFYQDAIRMYNLTEAVLATYTMDPTNDYHTYRITLKNLVCNVYVDGILRMTGTASSEAQTPGVLPVLSETTANGDILVDYIYYRTDGAFAPGSGVVSKPVNQMEREWLQTLTGVTAKSLPDMWSQAVSGQSLTPSKDGMDANKFIFFTQVTTSP